MSFKAAEGSNGSSFSLRTWHASDHGPFPWLGRQSGDIAGADEVANEGDFGLRQRRHLDDPDPSHFDLAGDGVRRRGDKLAVAVRRYEHLIVGDEQRAMLAVAGQGEKAQREIGFAGAGRTAQQGGAFPEGHAGAVHELARLFHCLSGG